MNTWLADLFATGRAAEAVLAFMAAEAVVIALLARRSRRRFLPVFAATLAAGACLVLALRAALTGAPWFIVSAWLLAAGAAHAWDVALRWRANASSAHGREQKLVGRVGIEPTTKGL